MNGPQTGDLCMESPRNMLQTLQQFRRSFTLATLIFAGMLALHANTSLLHAQVAEICANGIDDDGDTLIDCDDPDCNFPLFSDGGYGNSNSRSVALGDVDGDGDLDAWIAEYGTNDVWLNQGGDQGGILGKYVDSGQQLGGSNSWDVALGDLDSDGDLDAWVANANDANSVWINQGGNQGGNARGATGSGGGGGGHHSGSQSPAGVGGGHGGSGIVIIAYPT